MSKRYKVAVVGAGISNSPDGRERWAVRAHLPALKALPELFETVAVCTTRMETANAAAKKFGVPHAYDNVERMLAEHPEIESIPITSGSAPRGLPQTPVHDALPPSPP